MSMYLNCANRIHSLHDDESESHKYTDTLTYSQKQRLTTEQIRHTRERIKFNNNYTTKYVIK